jgi:hypothetical protein
MIHLLTEATIFDPQPNNCFLQLAGQPMDGLRTLAKIEEEVRACEAVERKRKMKEDKVRARKRRKVGAEGDGMGGREGDVGAVEREVGNGKKSLSRHTSGVSIADGGPKLVYVHSPDFVPGFWVTDTVLFSGSVRSPIDVTIPRMKMFYARHRVGKQARSAFKGLPDNRARLCIPRVSFADSLNQTSSTPSNQHPAAPSPIYPTPHTNPSQHATTRTRKHGLCCGTYFRGNTRSRTSGPGVSGKIGSQRLSSRSTGIGRIGRRSCWCVACTGYGLMSVG